MSSHNSESFGSASALQEPDMSTSRRARRSGSATMPLIRSMRLCWAKRRTVSWIVGAGTLLSIAYSLLIPPMYTSSTTIMPPNSSSSGSALINSLSGGANLSDSAASAGSLLLGLQTPGAEFVGILQSRTMKESLVKRFDLQKYYKAKLLEDACKALDGDTHIIENQKNGQISITVRAKSPVLAANIAKAYVEELDRLVALDSTSSARRERVFLESRIKEIRQDLDISSKDLSQFAAKNNTLDITNQGRAMIESSMKLQAELAYDSSQLAALQQEYSADNIRVRAANARVGELEKQLAMINGRSAKAGSPTGAAKSTLPSIGDLPSLGVSYEDLARRVTVDEAVWLALTKQLEMAKVQEAKEIPVVHVLDPPNIPGKKTSPVRSLIVISGFILSLLIAFISLNLASFWESMDPEDERKKLVLDAFSPFAGAAQRLRKH
jgi:uncharacterized protein involved in exopolysaccharide biosynthesis